MIKASGLKMAGQPYLTKVEDPAGKSAVINSSHTEQSVFLSPSQLLQAGLAGCMRMTVQGVFMRDQVELKSVDVEVDMVKDEEGKVTFTFEIMIDSDADPQVVERLKEDAIRLCYVRGILGSEITVREK